MWTRLMMCAILIGTAWAGMKSAPEPAPKVANVDGEAIIPGKLISAQPMFEIRNLHFWDGQNADTGARCTIVTGDLWNPTPSDKWTVKIEVEVWIGGDHEWLDRIGVGTTTIEHPGVRVPVAFRMRMPPCYNAEWWKNGCRINHSVRLLVSGPGR